MNWWQAIILGIVQGATEFLPISSSGHLVIFERILGLKDEELLTYFSFLHVGTLFAVFIVMWKEIKSILTNILGKMTWLLILATIPAVIFTLLFGDFIDSAFKNNVTLGYEFIITGVLLLSIRFIREGEKKMTDITATDALLTGVGQSIAIMPAISRSGTCLTILMFRKLKREEAVKFAFLMSIPAILGSFAKDMLDIFQGDALIAKGAIPMYAIGIMAAAIAGILSMKFMLKFLDKRGFLICGAYVILLGIFVIFDQQISHVLM